MVDHRPISFKPLLYWIANFFSFGMLIEDGGGLTIRAEKVVAAVSGVPTTQNDIDDSSCADVTIIFAWRQRSEQR